MGTGRDLIIINMCNGRTWLLLTCNLRLANYLCV
jgi:hypothetical protein